MAGVIRVYFSGIIIINMMGTRSNTTPLKKLCLALFKSGLGGLDIKTLIVTRSGEISKVIVAIPCLSGDNKVREFIKDNIKGDYELIINGTGRYVKHSSIADCGTTRRKLVVDFYGNGWSNWRWLSLD